MHARALTIRRLKKSLISTARSGQLESAVDGLMSLREEALGESRELAAEITVTLVQLLLILNRRDEAAVMLGALTGDAVRDISAASAAVRAQLRILHAQIHLFEADSSAALDVLTIPPPELDLTTNLAIRNDEATVRCAAGDFESAYEVLSGAVSTAELSEAVPELAPLGMNAAFLAFKLGRFNDCIRVGGVAADICASSGWWIEATALRLLEVRARIYLGQLKTARAALDELEGRVVESHHADLTAQHHTAEAEWHLFMGEMDACRNHILEARELFELATNREDGLRIRLLW